MGNRADRRASAKIARQAVKRAKTPTEGAILRSAAAFAGEGQPGDLFGAIGAADFDETWTRLEGDLQDILEQQYTDFRIETYLQAGTGRLPVDQPNASQDRGTRLVLCPLVGEPGRLSKFAKDPSELARLGRSFEESGVVLEGGRCTVFPVLLPLSAFAPGETRPGRVRRLHDALADRLAASLSGTGVPTEPFDTLLETLGLPTFAGTGEGPAAAVLAAIELMPPLQDMAFSEDELEAEDLARAAAEASWHDSYAADVPDLAIGAPLDWPAAAANLAWESVAIPMEAARRRRGLPEGPPDTIHCGPSDDGRVLVVSALYGGTAVGPFSVPTDLVWLDADAFFDRAETAAETLVEHDSEDPVIAPLLAAG